MTSKGDLLCNFKIFFVDFQGSIGGVSGVSERISTRGIQKHHLRAHSRTFFWRYFLTKGRDRNLFLVHLICWSAGVFGADRADQQISADQQITFLATQGADRADHIDLQQTFPRAPKSDLQITLICRSVQISRSHMICRSADRMD